MCVFTLSEKFVCCVFSATLSVTSFVRVSKKKKKRGRREEDRQNSISLPCHAYQQGPKF